MTDRELLELAAHAAGYNLEWDLTTGSFICFDPMSERYFSSWNPLSSDGVGDAFKRAIVRTAAEIGRTTQ